MISKPILGELIIDEDGKKIWINTPDGCLLRCQGIEFNSKKIDKISFIDINKENVNIVVNEKTNSIDLNDDSLYGFILELYVRLKHMNKIVLDDKINEILKIILEE